MLAALETYKGHAMNRISPRRVLLMVDCQEVLGFMTEDFEKFQIVGLVRSNDEMLAAVERSKPHVVVMDFSIPNMNVLEAVRVLKARAEAPRVVVLMSVDFPEFCAALRRAGADGVFLKSEIACQLPSLIERLCPQPVRQERSTARPPRSGRSWFQAVKNMVVAAVSLAAFLGACFAYWSN